MNLRLAACALALAAASGTAMAAQHPFNAHDLAMMDRMSDPHLSPDGNEVAFSVRSTDWDANKGVNSVWLLDLSKKGAEPRRVTELKLNANSPAFSPDGKTLYFLATENDSTQLWSAPVAGGEPVQVTHLPLDIDNFKLSPDGKSLLFSSQMFEDCTTLECTRDKLDAQKKVKATGRLYRRVFVRHWDEWSDHRRGQLFVMPLDASARPVLVTRGIDGDVPSKPDGGNTDYAWSPDGRTVYFDVRIAGKTEPWSTNFDVYSVPADGSAAPKNLTVANAAWDASPLPSNDGKTLYYLAMKVPGFEADRFGIMALDLATGATREIDPHWDRSAGPLTLSADGKTLYTTVADDGNVALYAVDIASGKPTKLLGDGSVLGFDVAGDRIVAARQDFTHPTDLYTLTAQGKGVAQVTHFNASRLADIEFSKATWFTFKGWNGDTVHGYVMPPVGAKPSRKYPVAFIIHGGPQGAWPDEFHYRWNPQTYAGAGFAVVAINFHGSVGYGQAFTDAISQHWGDRPLEDLQKGWAAALQQFPYLDGNDACALGASYGGYMVYWIAGVWNQPWKCLVDHDGVFDARMMYYATDELWFEEHENGGPQFEHPENYEKFNPVDHVKDWRVPMLVVHDSRDYRIPESQGLGAFNALQRRGIPSEFLNFPDENHLVLKPQNSVMWHETVIDWLKRWTGSGASAAVQSGAAEAKPKH
ncbi:MAG TPA: S9 family peptidase [Rhodanobacteraceae bacterium]|jgi:dipeptidyl aminopeptidase/acylaminoacyl peptidase|nr:S9 family peptidase [Rhodanobacteraceae bacterium]